MHRAFEPSGGVSHTPHLKVSAHTGFNSLGTPYLPHRATSDFWSVSADEIPAAAGQDKSPPPSLLKKSFEDASSQLAAKARSTTSQELEGDAIVGEEYETVSAGATKSCCGLRRVRSVSRHPRLRTEIE
jgi:hypothetical protein